MPPIASSHPSLDELQLFGQGRLAASRQQEIEQHIEACDTCCEALRSVPDDTLLGRLRATDTLAPATDNAAPQPATDALPAELRDHPRYRIVRRLGAGGMGVVYKAEHRMMERPVALKVINQRLIKNQLALDRFRVEVKAAARLSHPNIVTAHDADQAGELQILVMEFVDGISVARQVEKAGPMPIRFACQFARQAALGLQHAHEKGMVHRDIKPQNLMLTREGRVKILDFGLARFAREAEPLESAAANDVTAANPASNPSTAPNVGLTQDGTALGTPDYMAPEQIRNARNADIRADIYSLGCTLYFMLAGHSPYPQGTALDKLAAHLKHEPLDLAIVRPDTPAALIQIIDRMLAKNPADRYATPAEVAEALAPLVKADASRAAAADTPLPLAEPSLADLSALSETVELLSQPTPPHLAVRRAEPWRTALTAATRHRKSLAALAVVLLVGCIGFVANGWRNQTPPQPSFSPPQKQFSAPPSSDLQRNILLVVPHDNFWPPDVNNVRRAAQEFGVTVRIASSQRTPAQPSSFGPPSEPLPVDLLLQDANARDFDTVIFSGANPPESFEHLHDPSYAQATRAIVQNLQSQGKPIASICLGSRVLADLGFLKNKPAARCPFQPQTPAYESSAIWTPRSVQTSLPYITAADQNAAKELVKEIANALSIRKPGTAEQ